MSQCISSELCNWYQEKGILGKSVWHQHSLFLICLFLGCFMFLFGLVCFLFPSSTPRCFLSLVFSFSIFLSWPLALVQKLFRDITCKKIIYMKHFAFSTTSFGLEMGWKTSMARGFGREIMWRWWRINTFFFRYQCRKKACCIPV